MRRSVRVEALGGLALRAAVVYHPPTIVTGLRLDFEGRAVRSHKGGSLQHLGSGTCAGCVLELSLVCGGNPRPSQLGR